MFIGLGVLAVISPLYINRRPVIESEDDEQSINLSSWLPLLLLLLILAIALSMYADKRFTRTSKFSSYERLVGIGMGLIAVISPLYINRRPDIDPELEEQSINLASWLPLLLLVLILAIALSLYLDQSLTRKKLDPLEAYVPAVILTQFQIKDLEKTLEVDQPQFADCRYLLRSGPAASLRINIRAVAQYASDAGSGNTAFNDVDQCLRALEELDALLLLASRNDPAASVKSMKAKIGVALDALDRMC
ncbi:hypothetical protein GH714_032408 [Hevea brasiliensis]|uniref:DUF7880 domain-containing protein n=1 Tax=Hevea brasiliensis TaxID=3981 RepID=A0A6A6LS61_HEVBR|nr:hypothetical protein GH714_029071 [Hevea brasiliensis]KAF2322952.1 hypothetical protein GH714_032408 [Hevea brasiliensis]